MLQNSKIFVGDIGILFRVYAKIDLSTVSSIIMNVKKGDGSTVSWTAAKALDNNYQAEYYSIDGDLNVAGIYQLSLTVTLANGYKYIGETAEFSVYDQFNDV
jgi:hypothetical protein